MNASPLRGLVIRAAVPRRSDSGLIYACDPQLEEQGIPHTITFLWDGGRFDKGECNYDAHSVCVIAKPESGFVDIAEKGYYSVNALSGMLSGDILENSSPPPKKQRHGGFRSVAAIAGRAYAVGLNGMVYRLDSKDRWTRIDDGLPSTFDVEAIHGFADSDICAVGGDGALWRFNGVKWTREELPTNANLNAVVCTKHKETYVGGMGGMLLRGLAPKWEVIESALAVDDIWGLEWFGNELYVSTMDGVYRLGQEALEPVSFGDDSPQSFNQLSAAEDVLWSVGQYDVMAFDGRVWTRVV